jgi:hypothetical protein
MMQHVVLERSTCLQLKGSRCGERGLVMREKKPNCNQGKRRGRDLLGHGEKMTEWVALTLKRLQMEELAMTWKESDYDQAMSDEHPQPRVIGPGDGRASQNTEGKQWRRGTHQYSPTGDGKEGICQNTEQK